LASKVRQQQQQQQHQRIGWETITLATKRPVTLGAAEAFVLAALAKAIATVATYPLQLTQTLLRLSSNRNRSTNRSSDANSIDDCDENDNGNDNNGIEGGDPLEQREPGRPRPEHSQQYKGTIDCLIQLYKNNDAGCAAWFTGMRAKLLQTVLTAAFTFLTYEQILGVVQKVALHAMRMRQKRIGGDGRRRNGQ